MSPTKASREEKGHGSTLDNSVGSDSADLDDAVGRSGDYPNR